MTEVKKEFKSTQYPSIVGSPLGWWDKPLNPVVSIVILICAIIFVFILGIWFTNQYYKIYSEIESKKTEMMLGE